MADGSLISFIDEEDIYSLFSNLLDNAIEAVSKCPIEKRTMGIRIENKLDQYVSITVYNYCIDSEFVFSNGLPKRLRSMKIFMALDSNQLNAFVKNTMVL